MPFISELEYYIVYICYVTKSLSEVRLRDHGVCNQVLSALLSHAREDLQTRSPAAPIPAKAKPLNTTTAREVRGKGLRTAPQAEESLASSSHRRQGLSLSTGVLPEDGDRIQSRKGVLKNKQDGVIR
jgi:hypothetical protein